MEEQYYEEQPQQEYGYLPQMPIKNDRADMMDKLKPEEAVETMRHKLMGEELMNGKWFKIPLLQHKAITDLGAWDLSNLMLGASTQNVVLSKLTDVEIRMRALEIANTAQLMSLRNWSEYGIKGCDQLHFIHQVVFTNTFITLKQCQDEGIRDLLKRIVHEQSSKVETTQKSGFSLFSRRRN